MAGAQPLNANDRHSTAVVNTLQWADEAAEREDYLTALEWVNVVEVIGDRLPDGYRAKKAVWQGALERQGTGDRRRR